MDTPPPRPINCPVCDTLLKVLHKGAEITSLSCLECRTTVMVPISAWAKPKN